MKPCWIYVPCSDSKEAKSIATSLLSQKLIACANLFPNLVSLYSWEDKIEESSECALLLKTFHGVYEKVEQQIRELHSYSCPCILKIDLDGANSDYLQWMKAQVTLDSSA